MSKEEKSLLDEIWEAAGLSEEKEEPKKPKKNAAEKEPAPKEEPVEAEPTEAAPVETEPAEAEPTEKEEKKPEKRKDIKFLTIYITVFVAVIGALIAGSYMISYRIHRQWMEENQGDINQSTLQNIQNQRDTLKEANAALTASNELLTEATENDELLIDGVGDTMEQDLCLMAAYNAYANEDKELATSLLYAIDPQKLSEPSKVYFEDLAKKLNLDLPVEEESAEETPSNEGESTDV